MKKVILYTITFLYFCTSNLYAQETISEVLKKYNEESIPYITVDKLQKNSNVILLDAREKNEFNVSHLKDATFVGYEKFNLNKTTKNLPKKDAKIVVYCSLGIRSEDIAVKLKKAGYTNVYNLFGGIFEWKNKGNSVFSKGIETEKVHACTEEWSKWLLKRRKSL